MRTQTKKIDPDLIPKPTTSLLLSFEQAGEQLGVCAKTIQRLVERGQLMSIRIGKKRFIHIDEVARVAFGLGGRAQRSHAKPRRGRSLAGAAHAGRARL
jgi:excisionase family DNA binding protein